MPYNRILNYVGKTPSWWKPTGNTAESLFDQTQRKQKSSLRPIQNRTAAEQWSLIPSSTRYNLTSNPTRTHSCVAIPIQSNMQGAFSVHGTINRTRHRDRHRWPIRLSGFETYGETQIPVWKTSRRSQKKCKRCIATRNENSLRQWNVWQTSSKERMNRWESTPIESRQNGEQRDGSHRITWTFTKSLAADYNQDLSPRSSRWPQRTDDLTACKTFLTAPLIQKSSRTAKSLNRSSHINSNRSQENHLNKAAKNATSDHPYPSRPMHCCPTCQSQTRMINALLRFRSRQSSMKLGSRKENAYTAVHWHLKHSGARNIHPLTSQISLLLQEMEHKSNASAPSMDNNQKTSLPLSGSSSAGENGWTGGWIAVIVYEGVESNLRGNSTASDFTKAVGCLWQPESSHVKSIFVWNKKTGFIARCPQSPDTRSTQRIAKNTSTQRLPRYKHLYSSTTSQYTRTTTPSSAHHNSRPWRSGDRACKGVLQDGDYGPLFGSFSPGPWTRAAGYCNEGIQSRTGITMVYNREAGDRPGYRPIYFIQSPKWLRGGTQMRYVSGLVRRSGWWKY